MLIRLAHTALDVVVMVSRLSCDEYWLALANGLSAPSRLESACLAEPKETLAFVLERHGIPVAGRGINPNRGHISRALSTAARAAKIASRSQRMLGA